MKRLDLLGINLRVIGNVDPKRYDGQYVSIRLINYKAPIEQ